jgi:hypothetical protein
MDPCALSHTAPPPSGPAWQRPRRCLLKGCEQWFRPARSQCRYCSLACRQAAKRWRCWRAQQKYRASRHGRQHRQQQACRYRQRCHTRPPPPRETATTVADTNRPPCEGQRLPAKDAEVPSRPCDRPGCYVLFRAGTPWSARRFCCALCRRALRHVLDREARRRRRRRRGLHRPGRRPRPPPLARQ